MKWYRTYTEGSRPEPVFLEASESSVYDLKEHPDFKFPPGAIVVRVAAGAGENCGLGAGQILDINTDGQVQVWWADQEDTQTTGLCYPQDIYKVQLLIYIFVYFYVYLSIHSFNLSKYLSSYLSITYLCNCFQISIFQLYF